MDTISRDMLDAYSEYVARQNRDSRPSVEWVRNKDGELVDWVLAQSEHMKCCDRYKGKGPQSIANHLRGVEHVANLFGVDYKKFRTYTKTRRVEETKKRRRNMASTWSPYHKK